MGVRKLQQERRYALVALAAQAEFRDLFDRVDGVAAGVREMIFAFEACGCSRKEEKSAVLSGWCMAPTTLPPPAATNVAMSSEADFASGMERPCRFGSFRRQMMSVWSVR